jgi:hypothetical protein
MKPTVVLVFLMMLAACTQEVPGENKFAPLDGAADTTVDPDGVTDDGTVDPDTLADGDGTIGSDADVDTDATDIDATDVEDGSDSDTQGDADAEDVDTTPDIDITPTCPGGTGCACELETDCDSGLCAAPSEGEPKICAKGCVKGCDDGNACTQDTCDIFGGSCVSLPQEATCDDANVCTENDLCADGTCKGTPAVAAVACDDGSSCTGDDACADGICTGKAKDCDDGKPCTQDSCDPATGECAHAAMAEGACNDGDPCTLADHCDAGDCLPGLMKTCNDGNLCTSDACDGVKNPIDGCVFDHQDGPCDDGQACTSGDLCIASTCKAGASLLNEWALGTDGDEVLYSVVGLVDGGLVAAGTSKKDDPAGDPWILKAAGMASVPAETVFANHPAVGLKALRKAPNGKWIAVGEVVQPGTGRDLFMARLSADMAVEWTLTVAGALDDYAGDVVAMPATGADGAGYVAVGRTGVAGGKTRGWVVRVDESGALVDTQQLGSVDGRLSSVVVLSDGSLIVAGQTQLPSASHPDGWALRVDPAHHVVWEKSFGGSWPDGLNRIVALADGSYGAVGFTETASSSRDFWFVRLDGSGKVLTKLSIPTTSAASAWGLAELSDGGYVLAGQKQLDATNIDGMMVRLDATQQVVWTRTYGGNLSDGFNDVVSLPGGRLAVVGWTRSMGKSLSEDGWILRTDGWGNPECGASGECLGMARALCNDDASCTFDTCSAGLGCGHAPVVTGTTCAVGGCTGLTRTLGSVCTAEGNCEAVANPQNCNDGDACTTDECDVDQGCTHQAFTGLCPGPKACDSAVCQSGQCVPQGSDRLFSKTWGTYDMTADPVSLVNAPDGGLVVLYPKGSAANPDIGFARFYADGSLYFTKTLGGGATSEVPRGMVRRPDSGFAIIGRTNQTSQGDTDLVLWRVSPSGIVLPPTMYGGTGAELAGALAAIPEGPAGPAGYLLTGSTASQGETGAGAGDAYVVRTDIDGKLMWHKWYGDGSSEHARAVVWLDGLMPGGFGSLIAARTGPTGQEDVWLVRTDATGKVRWTKQLGEVGKSEIPNAVAVLPANTPGGWGFVVVGTTTLADQTTQGWATRLDVAGQVVWTRTLTAAGLEVASALAVLPGGDLLVSGKGGKPSDGRLVRLDSSGNTVWKRSYDQGKGADESASVMTVLSDGGIALGLSGPGDIGYAAGLWVIRTDAWGELSCSMSSNCAAKQPVDCNDNNPCTADLCTAGECLAQNLPDGMICGTNKTCLAGKCN